MSAALIAGMLLGCGTLATPPSPVLGAVLEVEQAQVTDLGDGVQVDFAVISGVRRKVRVESAAFELRGLSGELARVDWTPVENWVLPGQTTTLDWVSPLEGSHPGSLVEQAPLVFSGTLEVHPPGGGTQLVPFSLPAVLILPDPSPPETTPESP